MEDNATDGREDNDDAMDVEAPRGTKRKADDLEEPRNGPRRIKALHQDVVNKIAAGEIIVAPVHALKELIENAVDAGSTSLEVLCREGGLKLLQIADNGCGIEREDLPILCERFTTSKLQKFEDLGSIATYGFRGEALASISHIAHLTVTTKTQGSNCAWRAHYDGGKLAPSKPGQSPEPKAVAGRQGTQITVEDLFYNVPTRRRAFRSPSDEYNKIIDMVGRYAVHCRGVAFSCKKHGEATTSIAVQAAAGPADRIRQIYGSTVANELIELDTADARWGLRAARGWATSTNHSAKKTALLLFVNHRCVESTNIKKALEQTYGAFLPKNGHPFVYLSLEIEPQRVDVNVHPTKREVNFLNEDEIIQAVCEHLRGKLAAVDASRSFRTQTLLTSAAPPSTPVPAASSNAKRTTGATNQSSRPYENNLVRTDTNLRKITSMFPHAGSSAAAAAASAAGPTGPTGPTADAPTLTKYTTVDRAVNPIRLQSIRDLRAAVRADMHQGLTEVFAGHTFVGVVDEQRRLAAVQGGVHLYLVDYGRACFEYLYQLGLTDFANMGAIRLSPALDLRRLLRVAVERDSDYDRGRGNRQGQGTGGLGGSDDSPDVDAVVETVAEKLITFREMLLEYFSLEVTPAGELVSIPLLLRGYTPPMVKLPRFLLRLGPHVVDWTDEKSCLDSILREVAAFYVPEQLPPPPSPPQAASSAPRPEDAQGKGQNVGDGDGGHGNGGNNDEIEARRKHILWAVEHIFFPAFKSRLVGTHTLMKSGVLEVADLKGLYRVFERC